VTSARLIVATVFDGLASLPDTSVDLVVTSPPYIALRSYLPADHPTKAKEIGSEPTPAAFIDTMLDVVEALDRVLAPHGSICIELGDTYSGSAAKGFDYDDERQARGLAPMCQSEGKDGTAAYGGGSNRVGVESFAGGFTGRRGHGVGGGSGWPLAKSLCMVPELFRVALAYGVNPLTGRETPPWRCRNVVRHFRPNPPVGALGTKFRPATSDWIIATKSATRWFDLDSCRTPVKEHTAKYDGGTRPHYGERGGQGTVVEMAQGAKSNPGGAPPLDWWADDDLEWRDATGFIESTFPYSGAHFATFSPKVVARLIQPQCPQRVCRTCGEPSQRIVDVEYEPHAAGRVEEAKGVRGGFGASGEHAQHMANGRATRVVSTLGWTDCGHHPELWSGDWRSVLARIAQARRERSQLAKKPKSKRTAEETATIVALDEEVAAALESLAAMYAGRIDGRHDGNDWRPGLVLDPFAGSGTTLQVATGHGREAVGIDLDSRNADLARERVGMFLTVEHLALREEAPLA